MLRLAQIHDIDDGRPAQAEVVQSRQLPDGLLEARLRGEVEYDHFLLEVAGYADRRTQVGWLSKAGHYPQITGPLPARQAGESV